MKRDAFTLPLAFPGELIIDNFAGGGTSTGLVAAFGRPVDIGPDAVEVATRAQDALVTMQQRYLRLHRFGPDADALAHAPIALQLYDDLLRMSSPLQLETALAEAYQRIADGQALGLTDVAAEACAA